MFFLAFLGPVWRALNEPIHLRLLSKSAEPSQEPKAPRPKARGGSSTLISAGVLDDLDPNKNLRGSKWYGEPGTLGVAGQIVRDGYARQSVNCLSDPLTSARWVFRPGDKSPLAREVADFCQWALIERFAWRQLVRRWVQGYVTNGFHLDEWTDDFRPAPAERFPLHPQPAAALVPIGFGHRPAWSIKRWHQDPADPSRLASVDQYIQGGDVEQAATVTIPADHLLRFTWDQEGADFEGLAVLRGAYGPWKVKLALLGLDAIRHERFAVPTPIGTLPPDPSDSDIDAFETALAEYRSLAKGFIIQPDGYKTEIPSGSAMTTDLQESIQACNVAMFVNVGAGFMMLSLAGDTGSNALGVTQQGVYHRTVETHADKVCSVINFGSDGPSIVDHIVDANYGPSAPRPRLEARNLPTRPWLQIADSIAKGVVAGTITADEPLEDDIRESLGLGPHDEATARKRPSNMGTPPTAPGQMPAMPEPPQDEEPDPDAE